MVEIEMQTQRRRRTGHAVAVERDELTIREQLEVLAVVRRLEPFVGIERRETDALELFEL